jgi:hypothetical protein
MKKILIVICSVIAFNNALSAQTIESSNVPAPITNAFTTAFSNAKNVKWEMDYDNYVAKFKKKNTEIAVTYNKDGKWISTEIPITRASLPAAVKATLDKEFSGYKETDIEKVDSHEGVNYLIDLEYNQLNYEVVISEKGDLISNDQVNEIKKD